MARLKTILVLLITASTLLAQQSSSLFQIITADLPIERNSDFRDLQAMLSAENAKELKGVNLDLLHSLLNDYKIKLLEYIQPPQIINAPSKTYFQFQGKSLDSVSVNADTTIGEELDKLTPKIQQALEKELGPIKAQILPGTNTVNLIFCIANSILTTGKIDANLNIQDNNSEENFVQTVSKRAIDALKKGLTDHGINTSETVTAFSKDANKSLVKLTDALTKEIVDLFNLLDAAIKNEVEKPLSENLKGLTGFSASKGSGVFSGGAVYSFNSLSGNLRASVYMNGNLNTGTDSTKNSDAHSIFGIRAAYVTSRCQIDLLGSAYFGDKQYKKWKVFEVGAGFNISPENGTVFGVAGFYTVNTDNTDLNAFSVGLMLKVSKSAPALVIGASGLVNSGSITPILQINYPINPL